ncbi:MAG: 2-oxoacid:acceptor oxidoreductase subunit alpha [Armatimonadetes bacterium]|nr:2-oxoacid:acceptor oxidoreductase subunit alpha [Armatimonadota bacterium]
MKKDDLVIRIAGEAGEGVQSTGQLVTQAAARAGYGVLTFYSPPAEIKGGPAVYQIRLSDHRLTTPGDDLDILIAFNQEGHDRNIRVLREGGLLIYDSAECVPEKNDSHRQVPLPFTEIAKSEIKFERAKNMVAVGAVSALFGLPTHHISQLITEKFSRKGEAVLSKNLAALQAGFRYVEEKVPERGEFILDVSKSEENSVIVVTGNQAISLGALAAGCTHIFGYPITPATDILEFLASELPKMGGDAVQAEDEISALGMVLGASFAGARALTATSGPGFSLMIETLGLATMAELPCVIVNVQRAGPSTGMPTRHEQGDLYIAVHGGHGESPRIVLAPVSVEDCFYQALQAFHFSEKFQTPVILLSDTALAVRNQSIARPDLSAIHPTERLRFIPGSQVGGPDHTYSRYRFTADGVSPMSAPGQAQGQYVATGLEHVERSSPSYSPETHMQMTEKRFRKLELAAKEAPPVERCGDPGSEIGIISWGSTFGVVQEAVAQAAEKGLSVEGIAPKLLWPIPDRQLRDFVERKRIVIVAEVNYTGQFAQLLQAHFGREFHRVNAYGGTPFKVSQMLQAIEGVCAHVGK